MTRILQANLNRSRVANDLLHQIAREKDADLLLISEQYVYGQTSPWYSDDLGTAAIWIPNPGRVVVREHGCGRGFVWVRCRGTTFVSVYLTPNESIGEFLQKLDDLEDLIRDVSGSVVVGGDFNAKALEWGMPDPDARGGYVLEMVARTGLLILNTGNTPTFRRPSCVGTIPDISFASERLAPSICNWHVIEDYTGSDHQYILFELREGQRRQALPPDRPFWNVGRIDESRFTSSVLWEVVAPMSSELGTRTHCESVVDSAMRQIERACEASIPRGRPRHGKGPVYWWTQQIAEVRRECLRLRRKSQRARSQAEAARWSADHKAKKKELRHAIGESKARCLRKLREDVDGDPWGLGYKIVTKKLGSKGGTGPMDAASMEKIVCGLFPEHPARAQRVADIRRDEIVYFSMAELEAAVCTFKPRKAPGPDGLPAEIWRVVFRVKPDLLLGMYNACLSAGVFPKRWKVARLVLVGKGKGDPELPSYYRPLCMLDTAGKVLEKMLRSRLQSAIENGGGLSPRQYGFRSGRSTMDAIREVTDAVKRAESFNHHSRRVVLFVTLDVRNAFNSLRWVDAIRALEEDYRVPGYLLRMMDDYLADRTLVYDTLDGPRSMAVTAGAAQGSVLGPDLWNASYDGLLRLGMPDETILIGYADDAALVVAARSVELAQFRLNQAMRTIVAWMDEHGLSLALSKTEIVVLTKRRIETILPLRVGETEVISKPAVKYLGVLVDCNLRFFDQIKATADKAARGVAALSWLMANVGGPKAAKRRLLMSSVQSVLLYGSEIWAHALAKEMYRKRLGRVQRRAALRVASAYRTVSEPAVLVIAGVIPIALLAQERQSVYRRKGQGDPEAIRAEERSHTLATWQGIWERERRSSWTRSLIRAVTPWLERRHGEVDYYLTQFLSGHGYFRVYLNRIGKAASVDCIYCEGVRDDAEHTFFACGKWDAERLELEREVGGQFSQNAAIELMLGNEGAWDHVTHYVQRVLRSKKADLEAVEAAERAPY